MISLQELTTRISEVTGAHAVHTVQFVGLEDPQSRELSWVTRSLDLDSYKVAMDSFTLPDPQTQQLTRSLLFKDFVEDAFWYQDLGVSTLGNAAASGFKEKQYPLSRFADDSFQIVQNIPLDDLLKSWADCLRERFGGAGATMWVSQKHLAPNGDEITSSIFLLLCRPLQERAMKYRVAKIARDFIINRIVTAYDDRLRRILDEEKERFSRFLSEAEDRVLLGEEEERSIRRLAPVIRSSLPMLVTGETGTGKSVIARKLHELSATSPPRVRDRFGRLNCALADAHSLEEQLFGRPGAEATPLLEQLRGGTLILEEIQHAPHEFQDMIRSRLLESSGRGRGAYLDFPRLIFTGSSMLSEEVLAGNLTEELFYQIRYFEIKVRPLRQRKDDLGKLSDLILGKAFRIFPTRRKTITDSGIAFLTTYSFPGNIRELENILIRAVATSDPAKATLEADDIQI